MSSDALTQQMLDEAIAQFEGLKLRIPEMQANDDVKLQIAQNEALLRSVQADLQNSNPNVMTLEMRAAAATRKQMTEEKFRQLIKSLTDFGALVNARYGSS